MGNDLTQGGRVSHPCSQESPAFLHMPRHTRRDWGLTQTHVYPILQKHVHVYEYMST